MNVIGDVTGKDCILFDDMVDTAGSLCNAAKALVEVGKAKSVHEECSKLPAGNLPKNGKIISAGRRGVRGTQEGFPAPFQSGMFSRRGRLPQQQAEIPLCGPHVQRGH